MSKKLLHSRRDFLRIIAFSGLSLGLGSLLGRRFLQSKQLAHVSETRALMGTIVNVTLVTENEKQGQTVLQAMFQEMERLINIFDHRQPSSPLAIVNRVGRLDPAPRELVSLLELALNYGHITNGAFDVTIKPVLAAYQAGRQPTEDEQLLVDYRRVQISGERISLDVPGAAITLDGIAKGRIVDGALAVLQAHGFTNTLVEAGGDLAVEGARSDGQSWRIGLTHPRAAQESDYVTILPLSDHRSAATSGDYVHKFTTDYRLHHIIDPRTGVSPPDLATATILAPTAADADALSTALMVLGPASGLSLAERLPHVEALIMTKNLTIQRTSGFPA